MLYNFTGVYIFGECKYWNKVVGTAVLDELERKADKVNWKKAKRRNHFILFSISGFSDELIKLAEMREDLILMS